MSTDPHVIEAHSVAEAYLYLKVTPCPRCLRGLLQPTIELTRDAEGWRLSCECRHCHSPVTLQFRIDPPPTRACAQSKEINATPEPSRAIDLVGWLNLFQQIVTIAARTEDRVEGRELALEAGA
ncbi:MAG: hypothetical protein KDA33_07235, partial [Phycisphaerales bacterium]|nr:hypothetical protein [Phycisphaerales bacterium]